MKKISLILILTFALAAIIPLAVSASQVDNDGTTWYGVPELLEYKNQVDQEFKIACGSEPSCIKLLHAEKFANDEKYAALYNLEARNFLVTEINHYTRKFKILFFDERLSLKKELGLKTNKLVLNNLYVSWLDDASAERDLFSGLRITPDLYYNNQVPGLHLMFGHRGDIDGVNWFDGYNIETEHQMIDTNFPVNNLGSIEFRATAVSDYSGSGTIGYSSCLKSEQYKEEAGCVLLVSKEKGPIFFPVSVTDGSTDELKEDNKSPDDDGQLGGVLEVTGNTDDVGSIVHQKVIDITKKEESVAVKPKEISNTKLQIPKAPDTGRDTVLCSSKTIEFPWWLVVLIALGDAVILWLFWPNGKKSRKK